MTTSAGTPKKSSGFTFLWIIVGITMVLAIIAAALGIQLKVPGFIGTRATLGAGLVVLAEIVMLITLWYGRSLARKKNFSRHKRVQTSVMLFNLVAIGFVMIVTFREQIVGPGAIPGDPAIPAAIAHGIGGALLELLGLYIVIRMWFEKKLPQWVLFENFKLLMQITLYGWTLVVIGGVVIFGLRYFKASAAPTTVLAPQLTPTTVATQVVPTAVPSPTTVPPTPTTPPVTGSAGIRDDRVHSDSLLVTFDNVPQPPSGQEYVGWLIGNKGEFRLNVGTLRVGADGKVQQEFVSPTGANLIGLYDEFIITSEPIGAEHKAPSDQIAFSAVVPAQARRPLFQLVVDAPDTPFNTGYLLGLLGQARLTADHANLALEFAEKGDVKSARRQAELVVNLIEGEQGKNFGDVDGDGRIFSDGNGIGILPRSLDRVKQVAQAAIDAPDATTAIKLHAGHVIICVDNARTWAEQLDAKALELAQAKDIDTAKSLALDVNSLARKLRDGVDIDNDEVISPIPGEGTIEVAYKHAQFASSPVYQAPVATGGAPLAMPEATPTPQPTAAPTATPAPSEVVVLMQDFTFAPQTITIRAGSKVTWINKDNTPHTATADDNTWDTGTLGPDQSSAITFDKPGEFPYYCLFHGGPGGAGMAGKIIVTP